MRLSVSPLWTTFAETLAAGSDPGRRLRFKGAVAAIGEAVGVPTGEGVSRPGTRLFSERTSVVR